MKNLALVTALIALSFTTGFTCSKNAPEQAAQPAAEQAAPAADQAQMAAPAGDQAAAQGETAAQPASAETK